MVSGSPLSVVCCPLYFFHHPFVALTRDTEFTERDIFLIWREMPPNQNPQPRHAGQGYILFSAHEIINAPNLTKLDNRRWYIRHLARRGVAFG
jgi:hypothetical protein